MTRDAATPTEALSYLFVPASRPDRFEKALGSAADAVIIDLEDAVASDDKDAALEHLLTALDDGLSRPAHVRINAAGSPWFERDLAALSALSEHSRASLAGVLLPKAERVDDLERVIGALHGLDHEAGSGAGRSLEAIAIIESAVGVSAIRKLAGVSGLSRFAVGAADLSFDLDVEMTSSTVDWVYAQLVVESRVAGLAGPIASPPFEIEDRAIVEREAFRLRGLGASAQLCIHPRQVSAIHRGFSPSAELVAWAERVVRAAMETDGAVQIDGQMVDKPVRERAERVLARAR